MKIALSSEPLGEPLACSCEGVPIPPEVPVDATLLAAALRNQGCADGVEVCVYADGRASLARRPGEQRIAFRLQR